MKMRRVRPSFARVRVLFTTPLPWLLLVALTAIVTLAPADARAQFRFHVKDVETVVDANEVEVGDVVHVTLRISSESGVPERPELGAHAGFTVRGPSVSPSQVVMNINGRTSVRRGINATWTLQATTPGTFTVGPPAAFVGQTKVTSDPVRIHVVKRGALAGSPDPLDPFGSPSTLDPWKSFFGGPDDPRVVQAPPADPTLAVDHDDQSPLFLYAKIDKATAVIGEQITYTALLYVDPQVPDQDFITEHEAPAASFLRQTLVAEDSASRTLGYGKVRSRIYRVKQVRKVAFFPLTTGNLVIGAEELRYPLGNHYVSATSSELHVNVKEPPTQGRPPGYALGDTGHFDLSADVKPREIDQGDVTSVTVTLTGTGNVPRAQLPMPVQKDVSFMQPEISEKLGSADNNRFAAQDTFRYVARIDRDGDVDLGVIELPYYDPDLKAYGVAKATLGVVHVKKSDVTKAAPADPNPVVMPDAPPPLDALEGTRAAGRPHFSDSALFWALFFGSPLSYALLRTGGVAVSRMRQRRAARADSPEAELERRRAHAKERAAGSDGRALVAAVKRFAEEAILARVNVNVKGEPAEGAGAMLLAAAVSPALAKEAAAILTACADLGFLPGGVELDDARALWKRAEVLDLALAKEASA